MTDTKKNDPSTIAFEWWKNIVAAGSGQRRASLARIRRASTPIEVMYEPEALRLIERLPRNPDRVAVLAGVLAWVQSDESKPVARSIGRSGLNDESSALMSEGRFRRLLQTPANDLLDTMRRLVRLNRGKANVCDLSASILYWGDKKKKDWLFDYFAIAGASTQNTLGSYPAAKETIQTGQ